MPELQSSPSASIYNPRAAICRLSGILNRANSKPIGRTASLSALTWSSADRWCAVRTWPNWFTKRRALNWVLALASAALLILTFPRFQLTWLAPVALAPLLYAAARELRPFRRFLLGWAAGTV